MEMVALLAVTIWTSELSVVLKLPLGGTRHIYIPADIYPDRTKGNVATRG